MLFTLTENIQSTCRPSLYCKLCDTMKADDGSHSSRRISHRSPFPDHPYTIMALALHWSLASHVFQLSLLAALPHKRLVKITAHWRFFLIYLFFLCLLAAFPACTSPFIVPESERWQKCLTDCHLSVINKDVYVHCALVQACCHGKHVPLERLIADIKLRCSVAHDK